MKLVAWLIRNGIPFDVAHALPPEEQYAYSIAFSEFESGREFNWDTGRFIEK